MDEITIELPQLTLRALTWGPAAGPLAVLLHGFPDTAHTWRYLGPALAEQGWRVVAPFLRGYAPSDLAPDDSYAVAALVGDVLGLYRALGGGPDAALVGHDWGAITANALVAHEDCPFTKVVILSAPPIAAIKTRAVLRAAPRQLRNSWYVVFSRLPWLPERTFERLVRRLWNDWSPGYDASDDLAAVLAAMPDPAHRRAAFGYYRALLSPFGPPAAYRRWKGAEMKPPKIPVLYLHGAQDGCLDPRLMAVAAPNLPVGSVVRLIAGAGHFPQVEQPASVNRLVVAHLGQLDSSPEC